MSKLLTSIALTVTVSLSCAQRPSSASMSVAQATIFALAAIPPKTKRLPQFGLELENNTAYPGLHIFNATWAGLPGGSMEAGFYAVDPITGAVWAVTSECQQLHTPKLRSLQARWRHHSGLSAAKLTRLGAKGPQC